MVCHSHQAHAEEHMCTQCMQVAMPCMSSLDDLVTHSAHSADPMSEQLASYMANISLDAATAKHTESEGEFDAIMPHDVTPVEYMFAFGLCNKGNMSDTDKAIWEKWYHELSRMDTLNPKP